MALIATKARERRKPPFFSQKTLDKLKCTDCTGYLSTPPIMKHPELGSICGNCVPFNKNKQFIRNTEYETIAQFVEFPCKNQGCQTRVQFGRMDPHDLKCKFRQYDCPLRCQWCGNSRLLLTHFRENHNDLLIETNQFMLKLTKTNEQILLLVRDSNQLFFIQTKCVVMLRKFWCSVSYIGDPELSAKFKYKLQIIGDNRRKVYCTEEKGMKSDVSLIFSEFSAIEINISTMLRALNCPLKLVCIIHIKSI